MYIQHLSHSGFILEDDNNFLVFDPIIPFDVNDKFKSLYIFISHSHKDHFEPSVLKKYFNLPNVYFILSKDTSPKIAKNKIDNIYILDNYKNIRINHIDVSTYGSTDKGNSYLISFKGKNYFHSGDLNWWHWKRMNSEELHIEESIYKKEIDLLKGKTIDFAFIPVDPRLEEFTYLSINYFIETLEPKYAIPMHVFGQYRFYKDLHAHVNLKNTVLINIDGENNTIYSKLSK